MFLLILFLFIVRHLVSFQDSLNQASPPPLLQLNATSPRMRKHFNGSVFLPLLLIAVFGFNAVHSANYCSSKGKLTTMFIAGNKIYFGFGKSSGSLFTFDIDSKKHGSISGGKTFGTDSSPVIGVHFDPIGACFTNTSNAEYCSHSEVFDGMVIFIDGKRKLSIQQVTKKGAFKSYNRQKSFVNEKAILPTTNSRLYAAIYLLFEQVANSKNPKFTAATYNSFVDGLFLAATIDDSVANLPEWGVGKYVIFWTNFAPNGLIQDAYVYAQMDAPVTGLIDYNGELFALMESGTIQMIPPLEDQKSSEKMTNRKASGGKARGTVRF